MARQVLPIVGAVIGAYFGGPQGAQIGYAIGSLVGNAVDPLVVDGPKIGDVANQTSSEGVYQPIYFGTAQGAGNIIAQGPNVIRKRRQSQGKGGGPITVTETLFKTFAIRIGVSWRGEEGITGVSRIWENGKLVYDIREGSTIPQESAEFSQKFRLYLGTDTHAPDPALEAIYGVGNTPSYRGRAYIVFPLYDITQWKAIPQYTFEVVTGGALNPPVAAMALARFGSNNYWISSPDGIDWSSDFTLDLGLNNRALSLTPTVNTFVSPGVNVNPGYIVDGNLTWQTATGEASGGTSSTGLSRGWYSSSENVLMLPKNGSPAGSGILKSTDRGLSYTAIADAYTVSVVCHVRFNWFFFDGIDSVYYSFNSGASWTGPIPVLIRSPFNVCRYSDGIEAMLGGSTDFPYTPILGTTTNGYIYDYQALPSTGGAQSIAVCALGTFPLDDSPTYVAVTDDGQILYRTPASAGWFISDDDAGGLPKGITFNGRIFILVSGDASVDANIVIKTSDDGINWTTRRTDAATGTTRYLDVASLAFSGGSISDDPPTLDQVISAIHEWCGQPSSEYDVSTLSDIVVRGLILAGGYSGKDAINTLQNLWMVDSPEFDKVIHYRKRGADVVATITFDDLIDEPEEATREQAIEYPKKLHLDYQSPDVDYAPAKATSSRSSIDARVIGELNVQVPVVLTPTEAFQRANVLHKVSWADADGEVVFYLPDEYLYLVPGDCIALYLRESIRRLRIDKIEYFPGSLKLTCRGDRQSAYTSNVEGLTPPPPTPPPPSIVGDTMLIVGDWPALRDQDDVSTPVKYISMGGTTEAWSGALGEQSSDGGNTYSEMVEVYSGAVMGSLTAPISDAAPYFADHTNVVSIRLDIMDGSIEIDSLTEAQFLNEQGGFALVKSDGSFEILQYRDANDLGDGLFELSYLQRGRLNSQTYSFDIGDRFVLLSTVAVVSAPSSQLGVDMYHRATSFGQTTEDGTVVHDVYEGNSQKEWPVAHVLLERSGDTITGTIVPRHRFGTEINPVRSINWTNYEITFQDSLDQVEAVTQTGDTFSYDASAMAFPVTVTVYQVNRITGAGPGKSEIIE